MGLIVQLAQQLYHTQPLGYPSSPQWGCSRFSHVSPPPVRQYVGEGRCILIVNTDARQRHLGYRSEMFYLRVSSRNSTKIMCCKQLLNVQPSLQIYHPLKYWKENASIQQCAISIAPIKARFPIWDLNVTALPWSGWAAYKMLGFDIIAASLANLFPCSWLVSVYSPPYRNGAATNAITAVAQH